MTSIRTIFLIRHARSTANVDPAVYLRVPDPRIPLAAPDDDPGALRAARLVRAELVAPDDVIDSAALCSWTSSYDRCRQTEALVTRALLGDAIGGLRRRESFLLREQEFGDWDGLTEDQVARVDPQRVHKLTRLTDQQGRFYFRYPNGESRADVVQRVTVFLGKLQRSSHRDHIIFLHGVTQRALRMAWFDRSPEWFESEPNPHNASVLQIYRGPDGRWTERYLDEESPRALPRF